MQSLQRRFYLGVRLAVALFVVLVPADGAYAKGVGAAVASVLTVLAAGEGA